MSFTYRTRVAVLWKSSLIQVGVANWGYSYSYNVQLLVLRVPWTQQHRLPMLESTLLTIEQHQQRLRSAAKACIQFYSLDSYYYYYYSFRVVQYKRIQLVRSTHTIWMHNKLQSGKATDDNIISKNYSERPNSIKEYLYSVMPTAHQPMSVRKHYYTISSLYLQTSTELCNFSETSTVQLMNACSIFLQILLMMSKYQTITAADISKWRLREELIPEVSLKKNLATRSIYSDLTSYSARLLSWKT